MRLTGELSPESALAHRLTGDTRESAVKVEFLHTLHANYEFLTLVGKWAGTSEMFFFLFAFADYKYSNREISKDPYENLGLTSEWMSVLRWGKYPGDGRRTHNEVLLL